MAIVKPFVDDRHDTELACFSTASIAPKDQVTYSRDKTNRCQGLVTWGIPLDNYYLYQSAVSAMARLSAALRRRTMRWSM